MIRLEDLTPNASVRGIIHDALVTVVSVKWFGSSAVELTYKTPEGKFVVGDRLKNPDWYRNGRKIPFGHPDNRLGTRWLGFKRTARASGYGIHGTDDPSSIGKEVSEGCVRLENADVEELFEWVGVGTEVEIVR